LADQRVRIHQRQVYRRALRDPAPLDDPPVEVRDDIPDLLLAAQFADCPG